MQANGRMDESANGRMDESANGRISESANGQMGEGGDGRRGEGRIGSRRLRRATRFWGTQVLHTGITGLVLILLFLGAARAGALDRMLTLTTATTSSSFTTINYQGRLADSGGDPIDTTSEPDGLSMIFALYDAETDGAALWSETHANVPISQGLFSVKLGSLNALNTGLLSGDRWLGIQVGNDPEMLPREKLAAVPYAMVAGELDGRLENNLHISHDGREPSPAWSDYTLSLKENTSTTGNQATLRFENGGVAQGHIRLDGTYSDRRLVFGDDQGQMLDGEFTGGLYIGGRSHFGTPGQGEGGEIVLVEGDSGNQWNLDNRRGQLRAFHDGITYMTLSSTGNLWVQGSMSHGASIENNLMTSYEQLADSIPYFSQGDLLCWDSKFEMLEKCTEVASSLVIAVADESGKPIVLGAEPVKVLGPVQVGDFLVASDVPGYAMVDNDPRPGTVIAQALESFEGERGMIKAMIRKF